VLRDLRIDQFPEVGFQPVMGPLLIRAHKARVPRHVGGKADRVALKHIKEALERGERCRFGEGWRMPDARYGGQLAA
jgi:hypothetical protein